MSFNYTQNIPAANNNPSTDQPDMQENTNSSYNIWGVDHYTYNNGLGYSGQHLQLQFPEKVSPVPVPTGEKSAVYTVNGVASSTPANIYFVNSAGTYPLNLLRAYGVFSITSTNPPGISVVGSQSYNFDIGSITTSGGVGVPAVFNIPIVAGVATGNSVGVVVNASNLGTSSITYSFTNPTLKITTATGSISGGRTITVLIYQI